MRLEKITARAIGPFRATVELDLSAIEGPIVAVCGGNGQGKSTLLELFPGALYRQTPTRGSLTDLAIDRNGMVEAQIVNGARYTLRHTVDAISGKGESVVLDEGGHPLLASAKVRDFDAWRTLHLPAPEVLYASIFSAQASAGFLDMTELPMFERLLDGYVPPLLPSEYPWPDRRGKHRLHPCAACGQPRNATRYCWRCRTRECRVSSTARDLATASVTEQLPSIFARMLIWRKRFELEGFFAGLREARAKIAGAFK